MLDYLGQQEVEYAFKSIDKAMGVATFKTARQVPKEMKDVLPTAEDIDNVETLHATSLQNNDFMSRISPKSRSLPTIIRSFKSAVSKSARLINPDFAWQPRYHDRIIRDQAEHDRIANYIQDNPMNWDDDDLYL